MSSRRNILFKLTLIYIGMIGFGLVLIGKIIYLQFFYDKELIAQAAEITSKYEEIEPNRGDIYSVDMKLLATSVPYFETGIDLNCEGLDKKLFNENIDSLSYCLSQMFPSKTQEQFKKEMVQKRDEGSRYYRFSSDLDYENYKKLRTFPLLRLSRYKGGFVYAKHSKRERPFGNLARRTIGNMETDFQKGYGLELAFDEHLKGIKGYTVMEKIAGNVWMPVSDYNHIEPRDGYDLITTIDISVQDIAETALKRRLEYHDASFGTAVVMEVNTGKVRAIVNLTKTESGNYIEDLNYAVGRATDPGSTFKLATAIVAMEDGYVEPSHVIETGNGKYRFPGKTIEDVMRGGYGTITFQHCFEVSSNVGLSKVIYYNYRDNPEKFIDRLYKMHLNKPLGVIIPGETEPSIPYPNASPWSGISLVQLSIGYEVQMTPLQVLSLYNAVANNGCMLRPIFTEELRFRGHTIKTFQPEIIDPSICSQQTLAKVRIMLEGVILNGTGRSLQNPDFSIAGKTGTAQLSYGLDSSKNEYHASFAGYFPADNPKYSIIVSIYEPQQNGYYGGQVAVPVFKEIVEKIYASDPTFYKEHTPDENIEIPIMIEAKSNAKELSEVYKWFNINTNIDKINNTQWVSGKMNEHKPFYSPLNFSDNNSVPNVVNMKLKDALVVLEEMGLKVTAHGRGKVKRQVPEAGTNINNTNKTISIYLDV
jgi:cell division protein FtsI (penicillin-binding protein 3)